MAKPALLIVLTCEMLPAESRVVTMQKNPKARFLPVVIFPAIMPAVLMPLLVSLHVPANLIGAAMGVSIGLAIVGIVWMVKGGRGCSTGN